MRFIGLDIAGMNSLACVRDEAGLERLVGSAYPERPSTVLLPLVRKERLVAGDEALSAERGSGAPWPPLSRAGDTGWSHEILPDANGRKLLAIVWQRLCEGGRWRVGEGTWQPPDGLPALPKPAPAECIGSEARAVVARLPEEGDGVLLVLAIPNGLPEEAQDELLRPGRLPGNAQLIWRPVAAAISWGDAWGDRCEPDTELTVIDAALTGVEISSFAFREQRVDGHLFRVPLRRASRMHSVDTGTLLADSPAPFHRVRVDSGRLIAHLANISSAVPQGTQLLLCGPAADSLVRVLRERCPQVAWPEPAKEAVVRGAALFPWRLARGWPTYLDVLPSLEIFTLTEEHEPFWLQLIPPDSEVAGGQVFQQRMHRRIFVEQGTARLGSWLQRSGEKTFRKLSMDLPVQVAQDAWVDLHIAARSAAGFARVRIAPSQGEFEIFGPGQSVLLNWQGMERVERCPKQRWPVEVKYGWPACGKLYAHRRCFDEFIEAAANVESVLNLHDLHQRLAGLGLLKERVRQTIAPQLAGVVSISGEAAPVNLLVCFGTDVPCEFLEASYANQTALGRATEAMDRRAREVAKALWEHLHSLESVSRPATSEADVLVYILGRMSGYSPDAFASYIARRLYPTSKGTLLFAAGRVLLTPSQGKRLWGTLKEKSDFSQSLNNNWLRLLVYVLYQRPESLREVPREHVLAAAQLCLDQFERQVSTKNVRILFMNSLRALALLLRVRRHQHCRDFLCPPHCPPQEAALRPRLQRALEEARGLRLRPAAKLLVDRTEEWLDHKASTDEMPPIAPPGEENSDHE